MVRRSFRRGLRLGLLAGIVFAVSKLVRNWRAVEEPSPSLPTPAPWPPTPAPAPAAEPASGRSTGPTPVERPNAPAPAPALAVTAPAAAPTKAPAAKKASKATAKKPTAPATPAPERIWVEPSGGVCPPDHPVKAKLSSKLFHLPGMFAYDRCNPDRCYLSAEAAESDGLTKAKR